MKRIGVRLPKLSTRQRILYWIGILFLIGAGVFGLMKFKDVFGEKPEASVASEPGAETTENAEEEPADEQEAESVPPPVNPAPKPAAAPSGPTEGVGTLSWVVNKRRPLNPLQYVPPNLVSPGVKTRAGGTIRADVAPALQQLFAAAVVAGHDPMFSSGYRSYSTQSSVYNSYVAQDGQAAADTYSARPGYSEHQTGLAADICNASNCILEESFGSTPFGQWLAANAHTYGFTIRYKQGKQHITGYTYEPWHLRYVGTDLAANLRDQTMEEYFGFPAAPSY